MDTSFKNITLPELLQYEYEVLEKRSINFKRFQFISRSIKLGIRKEIN